MEIGEGMSERLLRAKLNVFRAWLLDQKYEHEDMMREVLRGEFNDPEEVEAHIYSLDGTRADEDPGINFTYGETHMVLDVLREFDSTFDVPEAGR